jgi:hypothetical protein
MGCNKFEESGLLYVSGELGNAEARAYESHLNECDECRQETEAYKKERAAFYTAGALGESPAPAGDAEILRVCSNPKNTRQPAAFMPIMTFIKKYAPVPLFLMLVMVAIGGYVRYHSMNANEMRANLTPDKTPVAANDLDTIHTPLTDQEVALSDDSLTDSNKIMPRTRGNLDKEGVVTVKGGGGPR